jgi:hypothetical protein
MAQDVLSRMVILNGTPPRFSIMSHSGKKFILKLLLAPLIACRYISYLTAIKKAEEPLKRLKKKTRPSYSLFGTSPNVNDDAKDEERIRCQMILDVQSFGKDAQSLGVDIDSNSHFASLKEIVYATDPE